MRIENSSNRRLRGFRRHLSFLAIVLGATTLLLPSLAGAAGSAATPRSADALAAQGSSNITITQTVSSNQGWFCLPGVLILQRSIHNTPEYFELVIKATSRPCSPIKATAAIYGMPGNGVAWPQHLIESQKFTISKAGKTTVRFTKTCDPVQFDVVTGATPNVISPTGPWHGPLLFPFDMETSRQHWGCTDGTTTTTSSPCENYAARQMATSPSAVAPGDTLTVSGLGTAGTTLSVWITPTNGSDPGIGGPAATVSVPASGEWSVDFTIPSNAPLGTWSANAQASDCEAVTSVTFEVTEDGGTPSSDTPSSESGDPDGPGTGVGGNGDTGGLDKGGADGTNATGGDNSGVNVEVLSNTADTPLAEEAVLNASLSNTGPQAAGANPATANKSETALAWTGSNIRLPIVIGVALLVGGLLSLLRSRRAAEST